MTVTIHDRARRHARLRWLGAPLLLLGAGEFLAAAGLLATGRGSPGLLLLGIGATGLSLGVFGLHNDTALALASRVPSASLPHELAEELEAERASDASGLRDLTPAPRAAAVVTLLSLLLHGVLLDRLLAAVGS